MLSRESIKKLKVGERIRVCYILNNPEEIANKTYSNPLISDLMPRPKSHQYEATVAASTNEKIVLFNEKGDLEYSYENFSEKGVLVVDEIYHLYLASPMSDEFKEHCEKLSNPEEFDRIFKMYTDEDEESK